MISRKRRAARLALPFGLGLVAAFGQAPYDLPLLMLAALAAAVWLFAGQGSARQAALFGWALGFGYFLHALRWIVSPFLVDVARHGWMAPFAVILMAAGLALFWGAAFGGARLLSRRSWPLLLCWPAAEMVRAYIFTGFPWAMPAQALVDTLAGQALAWVGPHGVTLGLVAGAVALAGGLRAAGLHRWPLLALGGGVTLALAVPPILPAPMPTDRVVRLVQPNANQREKWDPALIPMFFDRQIRFTEAPGDAGRRPDLVVWSETAIPWSLEYAEPALERIGAAGGGTPVVLGVQRGEGGRYYNSLVLLDEAGRVTQRYDKHHLVPFGEYMPAGDLLSQFGVSGLAAQAGNGYSAGPGAALINLPKIGAALPLICYEAVFAHDVNAAPARPELLIQVTNDAWFGKGAGPLQHLAQARMRSIEQGLPLARAANTGVSAMIDPHGRVTEMLPLNSAGFIDAAIPVPLPPTLYSRTGDLPLALLLLAGLGAAFAGTMARRRGGGSS